jgi:glutathione S-transferase
LKYQLFYYPGNASLAPHLLLQEASAEYELVLVDRKAQAQRDPAYLAINPNGRIPALRRGELVLFEAAAICLHIADHHPGAQLIPALGSPARSHVYKWLSFLSNTVQTSYMAFRYPERHTDDPNGWQAVKRVAAERTSEAFSVLEGSLGAGPFVLGSRYSVCDAYLFMLASWCRGLPRPPALLPRIRAGLDATRERPATQRTFALEGLDLGAYSAAAASE